MATQERETVEAFGEALRRHGREQGGEIMSYAQQLLQEGRQEGWQEGRQEGWQGGREEGERHGTVKAVEGMLRAGVAWDVIETATGLDESRFLALKESLSASDK